MSLQFPRPPNSTPPVGRSRLARLDPAAFAVVMGTGIVAADPRSHRLALASDILLWIAAVAYGLIVALTVVRVIAFPACVRADLADPRRGFGFFTFVAATDVLGTLLTGVGHRGTAAALLAVGAIGWFALGYAVPLAVLLNRDVRAISEANGTWFLWVVGVQSVAVLAASLQPATPSARPGLALLAVVCWSIGVVLYAAVALLVTGSLMRRLPSPAELAPPYWIAMGATAITAVAGGRIAEMAAAPAVDATRGFVGAASLVFLAFGTWLVPLLLAVGWWRHIRHRVVLRYELTWWSIVFPLGMYAAAGHDLGTADHLPIVVAAGDGVGWIALAAWLVTVVAMLAAAGRQTRDRV